MSVTIPCRASDPPEGHLHSFPDDWKFGGANDLHPGADPRYRSSSYTYWSDQVVVLHMTSVPLCDEEAIDKFTWVAENSPGHNPVFVSVRRPDGTEQMLPVRYDKETDTASDVEKK